MLSAKVAAILSQPQCVKLKINTSPFGMSYGVSAVDILQKLSYRY